MSHYGSKMRSKLGQERRLDQMAHNEKNSTNKRCREAVKERARMDG